MRNKIIAHPLTEKYFIPVSSSCAILISSLTFDYYLKNKTRLLAV